MNLGAREKLRSERVNNKEARNKSKVGAFLLIRAALGSRMANSDAWNAEMLSTVGSSSTPTCERVRQTVGQVTFPHYTIKYQTGRLSHNNLNSRQRQPFKEFYLLFINSNLHFIKRYLDGVIQDSPPSKDPTATCRAGNLRFLEEAVRLTTTPQPSPI